MYPISSEFKGTEALLESGSGRKAEGIAEMSLHSVIISVTGKVLSKV